MASSSPHFRNDGLPREESYAVYNSSGTVAYPPYPLNEEQLWHFWLTVAVEEKYVTAFLRLQQEAWEQALASFEDDLVEQALPREEREAQLLGWKRDHYRGAIMAAQELFRAFALYSFASRVLATDRRLAFFGRSLYAQGKEAQPLGLIAAHFLFDSLSWQAVMDEVLTSPEEEALYHLLQQEEASTQVVQGLQQEVQSLRRELASLGQAVASQTQGQRQAAEGQEEAMDKLLDNTCVLGDRISAIYALQHYQQYGKWPK